MLSQELVQELGRESVLATPSLGCVNAAVLRHIPALHLRSWERCTTVACEVPTAWVAYAGSGSCEVRAT